MLSCHIRLSLSTAHSLEPQRPSPPPSPRLPGPQAQISYPACSAWGLGPASYLDLCLGVKGVLC